jgi:hypothetical protein
MDSFRIFFERDISPSEMSQALRSEGFEANDKPGEVQVWKGNARVYVYLERPDEIGEEDLSTENEWPIPWERLRILVGIEVRRNDESSDLAIRVADQLAIKFGGIITWDGMDDWEQLYKAYLAAKEPT